LTATTARARRLTLAGIIINRYVHDTGDTAHLTAPEEIQRVTDVPILGLAPDDKTTDLPAAWWAKTGWRPCGRWRRRKYRAEPGAVWA